MPDLVVTPVCGFKVTNIGLSELVDETLSWIQKGQGGWVLALNLDLITRAVKDPSYGDTLKKATVTIADGFPIVWSCKKKSQKNSNMVRVTGVDYTAALFPKLDPNTVGIIGGRDPKLALTKMGLDPASGFYIFDGKLSVDEATATELCEAMKGRRIVFLALGVPKQEDLIELLMPRMPETTFVGVGGTFDFIAGLIPRAPQWMQKAGLEWFFRLSTEPKRLWRRYLVQYPTGMRALIADLKNR